MPPNSTVPRTVTDNADRRSHVAPHVSDDFRGIVERAADRARRYLASAGKIGPTAFFAYDKDTMKVVSLSFKDEFQRDALRKKIREKALVESASAVLVLTEGEHEKDGMIVLSGVAPGMSASMRVDYSFDEKTKTVTSWKMSWLDKPVQNVFLDGIYDKAG